MPSTFSRDKSIVQTYFEMGADKYPGVYITWDRLTNDDFGFNFSNTSGMQVIQRMYSIAKAPQLNGNYVEIGRLIVPENEYLDEFGKPGYYYKITLIQIDLSTSNETIIAVSGPISGDEQLIKTSIAYEIKQFLDIPVYDDELTFNSTRTNARLGYGLIVYNPRPQIRISSTSADGNEESFKIIDYISGLAATDLLIDDAATNYTVITPTGTQPIETLYYELKDDGTIYFQGEYMGARYPVSIPLYDTVFASYRVKMFSSTEINDALYQALQFINALPGSPKFMKVAETPYYYEQALVTIGTYFLLRRLLMRLTLREQRLLFGDLGDTGGNGGYTAGMELLKTMLDVYKEQLEPMQKGAAYAYYPQTTTYSTELYQLPGSRSYLFRSMFFKAGAYG
jgi:hypothetical protein